MRKRHTQIAERTLLSIRGLVDVKQICAYLLQDKRLSRLCGFSAVWKRRCRILRVPANASLKIETSIG